MIQSFPFRLHIGSHGFEYIVFAYLYIRRSRNTGPRDWIGIKIRNPSWMRLTRNWFDTDSNMIYSVAR